MHRRYLAFDIETAKVIPDGEHDLKAHRPLGISCVATLASDTHEMRLWHGAPVEGQLGDRMNTEEAADFVRFLAEQQQAGYAILTWNGLGFDFDILAEESGQWQTCAALAMDHVDMMFHVFCRQGYGIALDRAAKGLGLAGKTPGMNGALAPKLWAEGARQKVLDYVAQDVRTTLEVARESERRGQLDWIARSGFTRSMPLPPGGWLTVGEALALPEPDTSWMSNPWPRSKFTGWTEQPQ
jgi:hypothetical protein